MSHALRQAKLSSFLCSILAALALGQSAVEGQNVNQTPIIFTNNTGLPDDQVFLNVVNSQDTTNTYGNGSSILAQGSYSLSQLMGSVSGTSLGSVPTIQLGNTSGQRFELTLGAAASNSSENVVSGYFETTTFSGTTNPGNNIDVSYVDGAGLPLGFSVISRSTGTPVALTNQLNPNTTNGTTMGSHLLNDVNIPSNARVTNTYNVTSTNGNTYTISGMTYAISPSNSNVQPITPNIPSYHDWSTNSGSNLSVFNTLTSSTITLGSYTTVTTSPAIGIGANINYNGTPVNVAQGAYSPFNPTNVSNSADPNNLFMQQQNYSMAANYKTDVTTGLTPTQIAALTASNPNIVAGTPGIVMTGSGTNPTTGDPVVGNFTVYITQTELNKATGLYGGNPQYTIMWTPTSGPDAGVTQYATQNGSNNLTDRIVGDLAAGTQWGWSTATATVAAHATSTNTASALVGTVFDPNYGGAGSLANTPINQLNTGQYFYLLSLEGGNRASWVGAGINPNDPLLYSNYTSDITGTTEGYTGPYTDRLLAYGPDVSYTPGSNPYDVSTLYIDVTLNPSGAYDVQLASDVLPVVPEPSTWAMLGLGLSFLLFQAARLRRRNAA